MKLVVERITSLTAHRLTKESVAVLTVELLPALVGDTIWIVSDGKREQHRVVEILTAIEGDTHVSIMEIARMELSKTLDRGLLVKVRGDVEALPVAS